MVNWTPDLQTNIPLIDTQHKELINYINDIVAMGAEASDREKTEKSMLFLGNYVIKHFSDEEKLQNSIGYPKYEQHCVLHREFVETYKEFIADYKAGISLDDFTHRLNKAVIHWVVSHIQSADIELAHYINTHEIQIPDNAG